MSATAVLASMVAALEAAGIPSMLTGSFAAAFHGAGRATMDVDLVVDPTALQIRSLVGSLPPTQYYVSLDAALEARTIESMFNVIDLATGWKVDLIVRKSRPFSQAEFDRRLPIEFDGIPLAVATVEDVMIAKLEWAKLGGSIRQLDDVAALLRVNRPTIDHPYLERWVGELGLGDQWEAARTRAG